MKKTKGPGKIYHKIIFLLQYNNITLTTQNFPQILPYLIIQIISVSRNDHFWKQLFKTKDFQETTNSISAFSTTGKWTPKKTMG